MGLAGLAHEGERKLAAEALPPTPEPHGGGVFIALLPHERPSGARVAQATGTRGPGPAPAFR
jgi:hypothetical protein